MVARPNPAAARDELRATGLRATKSRLAVLALVRASREPMSHAEVADRLADGGWDRATLYRNLIDLVDAGLLTRADRGDHVWRFAAQPAGHADGQHPHFVCQSCGVVECLPDAELSVGRRAPRAARAKQVAIELKGVCDACG